MKSSERIETVSLLRSQLFNILIDPYSKTLQLYSDALLYRRFYCVDDYANNLFEYISTVYTSLKIPQKVNRDILNKL